MRGVKCLEIRPAAFACSWYAGTPQGLKKQIEECFNHRLGPGKLPKVAEKGPRKVVGLVSPHAGYMYSGPVAAHGYYKLAADGKPDTVVIFSPNHTGRGSALAIMKEGMWRTPLGDAEIDALTAEKILHESSLIDLDNEAHAYEHSIELQLPFLQYLYGSNFKFVPICFMMQDLESSREVGQAVARALSGKDASVIASTDMTHYEPHESAKRKDRMAIEVAMEMDEGKYYSTVESRGISTCGFGPVVAAITATKALGGKKGQLLCYKTSGDITGDYSAVVGYASISFTKG
jgi:AmmeMemoRadiSam system protein B